MDADRNKFQLSNVDQFPKLPEIKKLYPFDYCMHTTQLKSNRSTNIRPSYAILFKEGNEYHNPSLTTPQQSQAALTVMDSFSSYLTWFSDKIKTHFLSNPSTNVEELQQSFLSKVLPVNKAFVTQFLATQLFSVHCETNIMALKNREKK